MKNILYLFVVLFLFASCDHELENHPNTDKGTAVANFKVGEVSMLSLDEFSSFSVNFDLDVITHDNFTSAPVFVSYNGGKSVEFDEVTSTSTSISFDKASLENVLGSLDVDNGDNFKFSVPYFVLNTTDTIRPTTVYTVIEKDENGVEKEVEKVVDNTTSNVDNIPYFENDLTYYVACPSSLEGEYTVVSSMTSTSGGALNNPTTDFAFDGVAVFTKVSPIAYEVSNGLGGMYDRIYGHWGAGATTVHYLDLCGSLLDNGTVGEFGASFVVTSSSISSEGVITVEWKNKWDDKGKNVYTPVK